LDLNGYLLRCEQEKKLKKSSTIVFMLLLIFITSCWETNALSWNNETVSKRSTSSKADNWQRTIIFIYGKTESGQDMFIRGGLDHDYAKNVLGKDCTKENKQCAIPIRHLNLRSNTTKQWKDGDEYLDWYGQEDNQSANVPGHGLARGTALDWTTNDWPDDWGEKPEYSKVGYGETPLNEWGHHYWIAEVEMDCSKTVNGWFELKSYISNGPGWEQSINQQGTPYSSKNHFAQCGKINVFRSGEDNPVVIKDIPSSIRKIFPSLYIRGTHNSWAHDDQAEMKLITDYTWQKTISFEDAGKFKFDVYGTWNENYGDNEKDGIADRNGNNIFVDTPGKYKVTFNDSTMEYSLEPVSQSWEGNYTINNQADLDALKGYVAITGDLTISGGVKALMTKSGAEDSADASTDAGDITTLAGLESLTTVGGNLTITDNDQLTTLDGLENLQRVNEDFTITNNSNLPAASAQTLTSQLVSRQGIGGTVTVENNLGKVWEGNYTINNQADLDALKGYQKITGHLTIQSDIESLAGLESLTHIDENLSISRNTVLVSLKGLDNLSYVGETLAISENDLLSDLTSLEGMETVNGLYIGNNAALINLNGLHNLRHIYGILYILNNPVLTNLKAFRHLYYQTKIMIQRNDSLETLEGFESITTVTKYLRINSNPRLKDLRGFRNLTTITQGDLSIFNNKSLTTIGIDKLKRVDLKFRIKNNPRLSSLSAEKFRDLVLSRDGIGGDITIEGNADIWEGDYTINRQADLDALKGYGDIKGDLTIDCDLETLDGLESLTYIWGNLTIADNDNLTAITALENLKKVDGDFTVQNNPKLLVTLAEHLSRQIRYREGISGKVTIENNFENYFEGNYTISNQADIDAIKEYRGVTGNFTIQCDLDNLHDLINLSYIGGNLTIKYNSNIKLLRGLSNLTYVGGNLTISNNDALTTISAPLGESPSGLDHLDYVGGDIRIENNPALTTLKGLYGITSIEGLHINNNNALITMFEGFDNLRSVGELYISDNDLLKDLSFGKLKRVENNFTIKNNPKLHFLLAENLRDQVISGEGIGGVITVENNFDAIWEGDYGITNQADLDALTGYVRVSGSLTVNCDLENLTGLESLTSIGGSLLIGSANQTVHLYNPSLTSLSGLGNLTSVEGHLVIGNNNALISLAGLENLTYAGAITINDNDLLINLIALEKLSTVGSLFITSNPALIDLSGLKSLTLVKERLVISRNYALTSLTGLENLTAAGELLLSSNSALTTLVALENLTSVGDLWINWNIALTTLAGLESINSPVMGSVNIEGNSSLTSIAALKNIPSIKYSLVTSRNNLTSLKGLENITHLESYLYIEGNNVLKDIGALKNLNYVAGDLTIRSTALTDLTGLENLTKVDGIIEIGFNNELTDLTGFEKITSIEQDLSIIKNDNLITLRGLENVTSVKGYLFISSNSNLTTLTDLGKITSVGKDLSIGNNNVLTSLAGLEKVTHIGESLSINKNSSLTTLININNLQRVGSEFRITYNPKLKTSLAEDLRDLVISRDGIGKTSSIYGNL